MQRHESSKKKDAENSHQHTLIHQERQRPPTEAGDLRRPIAFGNFVVTVDDRLGISRQTMFLVREDESRPGRICARPQASRRGDGPNQRSPAPRPAPRWPRGRVRKKGRRRFEKGAVIFSDKTGADGRRPVEIILPDLDRVVVEHLDEIAAAIDTAFRFRSTPPAALELLPGGKALRFETQAQQVIRRIGRSARPAALGPPSARGRSVCTSQTGPSSRIRIRGTSLPGTSAPAHPRSPQRLCMTASAAIPAVSVLRMRGPKRTATNPACRARCTSCSDQLPSGPIATSTERGAARQSITSRSPSVACSQSSSRSSGRARVRDHLLKGAQGVHHRQSGPSRLGNGRLDDAPPPRRSRCARASRGHRPL